MSDQIRELEELEAQLDAELAQIEEKRKLADATKLVLAALRARKGSIEPTPSARKRVRAGTHPNASASEAPQPTLYGENSSRVREAIRQINGLFNLDKVLDVLKSKGSKLTKPEISSVLVKMRNRGEIAVHSAGRGRAGHLYAPAKILNQGNPFDDAEEKSANP